MAESIGNNYVHSIFHRASRIVLSGVATLGVTFSLLVIVLVWSGILTP